MKCIVNVTEAWGIGLGNELIVSIRADLKRFRELTTGKTVVLGRKTLAGFPGGRPLKNRRNIVLTRDEAAQIEGADIVHNETELFSLLKELPTDEIMVIGGESVYRMLLPYCDEVLLTRTYGSYEADRFFPNLDELPGWSVTEEEPVLEENGVTFQYLTYRNNAPKALEADV
ncbi:MAG: dihydrofolate reductase [Ruminococcaceae bacterium]|nr:dihydrofolate reductase [Oscillospiraceae bacterium]